MDHGEFARRTRALLARGVSEPLANELRWCGNIGLVAEVERASDVDIAALNAAYAVRYK